MLSEIITWHTLIFLQVRKVWVKPHFPENLQRQYFANIPVGMRVTPAIIVKESPVIISQIYFLYCLRETVRSRCQIIRFSPLSVVVVKNILINHFKLDDKQAERLAFISNGSIERATLLSGTHALEKKNWLVDRLLKLEINDNLTFSKELFNEWHIQDLDILEEKRSHVKELLFSFLMYYRDLLDCKIGSDKLPIYHTDWRDALAARSRLLSEDVLFRILNTIKTSLEYLYYNANITLLLENMITKILHLQCDQRMSS